MNIQTILDRLIGSDSENSLEQRTMNSITFLSFIVGILSVLSDLAVGESLRNLAFSISVSLIHFILFFLSRFKHLYRQLVYPYVIIQSLVIVYLWYNFDGISGTSNLFYLVLMFLIPILAKGIHRWIIFGYTASVALIFLIIEYRNPDIVIDFSSEKIEILSTFLTSAFISLSFMALIIILFNSYNKKREEVENLNRKKDTFFSIIAHDLKSPLASLTQIGEYMWKNEDQIDRETHRAMDEAIYKSSRNTYDLLENLLQWASSESGTLEAKPESIAPEVLIESVLALYREKFINKNIEVNLNIEPGLNIYADSNMIYTVLRNLISNASKFTNDNGHIQIIARQLPDNSKVQISVIDNGTGIEGHALKNLFEIDSTFRKEGTDNETGTGIGLKLCKEFIAKNKGTITVESETGQGSSFHIVLPVP